MLLVLLLACHSTKAPDDSSAGVDSAPFAPPTLRADPASVDLGELDAPASDEQTVLVLNEGPGPIEILEIGLATGGAALSVAPSEALPLTLPLRNTTGLLVRCHAQTPAELQDSLMITTGWTTPDGEAQRQLVEVPLTCVTHGPDLRVAQADLELGPVGVPCVAEGAWTLINEGDRAARVEQVEVDGDDALEPQLDAVGALPWRLEAGSETPLPLRFTPSDEGLVSTRVTLSPELGEPLELTADAEAFLDEAQTDRFTAEAEQQSFPLTATPVRATLSVTVGGVAASEGWTWSSGSNSVRFTQAPGEGAAVEIRYHPEAPCGD